VRTDYDDVAGRYGEDRARFSVPRDDIIDELLGSHAGVRVLDLGCGTGTWLAAQRHHFDNARLTFLGSDPSAGMLAVARTKGFSNIIQAPAEHLPLENAAIDYVVANYSFHHFDKDRALDEASRVLTSDGVLRVNNIEPDAAEGWWVYELFPEAIALDAARFWPAPRMLDALEARGFAVDIKREFETRETPVSEALADAERRVVSELAEIDDDAYGRGLSRLRRAVVTGDTAVTTVNARLCVTARRTT
jgi:SAM-dependent methyltransferase